jgi:hypothetical protein
VSKQDIKIIQGSTFIQQVRWETTPIVYKPITGITQAAPVSITAATHGVPNGWRVAIVSVKGMAEINAKNSPPKDKDYLPATSIDANTIQLNDLNAADFSNYQSGGYVQYNSPVDLTGFTANMEIKDRIGGTMLAMLSTVTGEIVLDNTNKVITITLTAAKTVAYTWTKGVYDLELVSATGVVTTLLYGAVTVYQEVSI